MVRRRRRGAVCGTPVRRCGVATTTPAIPRHDKKPPRVRCRSLLLHPLCMSSDESHDHHERRLDARFYVALLQRVLLATAAAAAPTPPQPATAADAAAPAPAAATTPTAVPCVAVGAGRPLRMLRATVETLREMLARPLGGVADAHFDALAEENAKRLDVIRRYARVRKHPALFATDARAAPAATPSPRPPRPSSSLEAPASESDAGACCWSEVGRDGVAHKDRLLNHYE